MKKHYTYSRILFFIALLLSSFVFCELTVAVAEYVDDDIYLIAKKKDDDDDDDDDDKKSKGKKKKTEQEASKKKMAEAMKKYQDAQKAMKKKDWKKAIKLYKEAIKKQPAPRKNYYPYFELGVAYLNSGNVEKASTYCQQSKKHGQAPKANVEKCLTAIAQLSAAQEVVQAVPATPPEPTATPRPQPTPTPVPQPTQAPQKDTVPIVVITPDIPAETEGDTITIAGKAVDDSGIAEVTITRKQAGTRAIVEAERVQMVEKQFSVDVRLEPGPNEFIIEAVDIAGQKGTTLVSVFRKTPETEGTRAEGPAGSLAEDETASQPRNLYAVIIGIGDYQDQKIPELRFTVNDALGMYEVLTDPQFGGIPEENIRLLLDEDATVRNIKDAIGVWLKRQAREDDTVIIYYAGHGAPEGDETYWVTYDADIESLYATALSNNAISDMLDRVESKRVLTFLDSCYSAATVNRSSGTRDILVDAPLEKFTGEGRVVISASSGQQLSLEMEAYEHGVFTYYLLEALKGEADGLTAEERDGIIEVEEVWNYIRNQVTETSRKQGNEQTPKFQGGLTAGIPLTFDREFLEERARQRQQEMQEKQAKLQELFEQGMFEDPTDFECAYNMVEAGKPDKYIDGFVSGKLSAEMFNKLFKCKN